MELPYSVRSAVIPFVRFPSLHSEPCSGPRRSWSFVTMTIW